MPSESSSLVAQEVMNPPATQETWIWSLGRENPLEKGMATHFIILAWRIPWTEEPGGLSPWGWKELDMTERLTHTHTCTHTHTHRGGWFLFFTVGWAQNAIGIFVDDNNNDISNLQKESLLFRGAFKLLYQDPDFDNPLCYNRPPRLYLLLLHTLKFFHFLQFQLPLMWPRPLSSCPEWV